MIQAPVKRPPTVLPITAGTRYAPAFPVDAFLVTWKYTGMMNINCDTINILFIF